MKNLSLFDRKFLALCKIDNQDQRIFCDDQFRQACGIAPEDGYGDDTSSRLMQMFMQPPVVGDERTDESHSLRFAGFMKSCQETNIENLLAHYEKQIAHEAEIQACADRIAQHTAPGIPEDDTVRWLRRAGVPVTAENWMRLQFMGNPPTPPLDGELLASLPDWVRQELEPEETESAESVCGLDDEDEEE